MGRPILLLSSLCLALAGSAGGQLPPGDGSTPSALEFDTSMMKVGVRMDRATYFQGEDAEITLEVWNPGAPVATPLPFTSSSGCLYLSWEDKGEEHLSGEVGYCEAFAMSRSDMTVFAMGEHRELVLHSYDISYMTRGPVLTTSGAPSRAGVYRVVFRYGSSKASAEFEVIQPKIEASAAARVKDVLFTPNPRLQPPSPERQYLHVLALRANDETHICVSLGPTRFENETFRNVDGSFDPFGATPYKRVATSVAPVVGLSAAADAEDNLTIRWIDATGGQHSFRYPASFPLRDRRRNIK